MEIDIWDDPSYYNYNIRRQGLGMLQLRFDHAFDRFMNIKSEPLTKLCDLLTEIEVPSSFCNTPRIEMMDLSAYVLGHSLYNNATMTTFPLAGTKVRARKQRSDTFNLLKTILTIISHKVTIPEYNIKDMGYVINENFKTLNFPLLENNNVCTWAMDRLTASENFRQMHSGMHCRIADEFRRFIVTSAKQQDLTNIIDGVSFLVLCCLLNEQLIAIFG